MVNEQENFDTSVTLSGLRLDNPVVPASGTFGYGNDTSFYDINILGSFSFKGTTREARFGNRPASPSVRRDDQCRRLQNPYRCGDRRRASG